MQKYSNCSVLLQFSDNAIIVYNIYTESPRYFNIDKPIVVNVSIVMLNSSVTANKSITKVLSPLCSPAHSHYCYKGRAYSEGCAVYYHFFSSKIRYPSLLDGKNVTFPLSFTVAHTHTYIYLHTHSQKEKSGKSYQLYSKSDNPGSAVNENALVYI